MVELLKEFLLFARANNKLWMLPLVLILFLIGGVLVIAKGSVLAPFIYTVF